MAAMCAGTALPLLSTYPALLRLHASQLFTCCDGCCACASANASSRHKGGLYALLNALKAAVPPGAPPPPVQLCDRGDGSPLSKAESLRRWAHLSPHHVPDLVRLSAPPALYEFKCQFKCWTWANRDVRYGGGGIVNAYASGKPSTAEGHVFAFGGTEELLRRDKTCLVANSCDVYSNLIASSEISTFACKSMRAWRISVLYHCRPIPRPR